MTTYNVTNNMKILCWNIQSSNSVCHGNKFNCKDFCNVFEPYPIVCLQEIRQSVKYPGYKPFNNTRNNENNGGVCILVRHEIVGGIKQYPCPINDVIVCKVNSKFFNLDTDIFIVNSYVRPANTSTKTDGSTGHEQLHDMDSFLNNLTGKGCILMCGDFNSRIGRDLDYILNDDSGTDSFIPIPDDYLAQDLLPRNTRDLKTNSHKLPFLNMLINNRLHILNGRTLGDIQGDFTCIRPSGSSVVDYFIISSDHSEIISHMKIKTFTIFSDHKPLELTLNFAPNNIKVVSPLHKNFDKAPLRYKVIPNSKEDFQKSMMEEENKRRCDEILQSTYSESLEGTYSLNTDITNYLHGLANESLTMTKHIKPSAYSNNQPWFAKDNREGKQSLRKAAVTVSHFPDSDYLRNNFYKVKKHYKSLNKTKKDSFFDKINAEIEGGKIFNWSQFKKLKNLKSKKTVFDAVDMVSFEKFFAKLYANEHQTIPQEKKLKLLSESLLMANRNDVSENHPNILNEPFSNDEILSTVSSLKNGKSSSDDLISNEILKYLTDNESGVRLLQKLFNNCLSTGTYPWNNSIITPLHKKGCKSDPDNYRAIAVSSSLGKLFSTIILNRILRVKTKLCPDPINQLGFSKGAQTYDHILTLNTIVSKYKKLRQPVYAIFVDFRKAFDSVCREALFYKLAKQGITGKIFNILKHMYTNSTGQIKLWSFIKRV